MTQSLLDLVLDQATQVGARRVTSIRLRIGGLTDVVPDSIQFYLDAISRGTLAEGARVDSVIVAPTATCSACGQVFPAETRLLCPMCGGSGKVTAGAELFVESIEVEE